MQFRQSSLLNMCTFSCEYLRNFVQPFAEKMASHYFRDHSRIEEFEV